MKWPSSRSAGSCSYSRDGQNSLNTSVYLALFHWRSRGRTQSPFAPSSPQFVFVHPPPPHTPRLEGLWVELGGGSQVPHTAAVFSMGSRGSWPAPSGVWGRLGQRLRGREGGAEPRPCAHSEVKLSVVTYLTNSIVDEILQELYHSHKSLVRLLGLSQAQTCPPPRITRTSPHRPSLSRSWAVGGFLGLLFTPVLP